MSDFNAVKVGDVSVHFAQRIADLLKAAREVVDFAVEHNEATDVQWETCPCGYCSALRTLKNELERWKEWE